MMLTSTLIVLSQQLDALNKKERYAYTQMQRHRDARDRTKYNKYASEHDVILADIDYIVVRLREINKIVEQQRIDELVDLLIGR